MCVVCGDWLDHPRRGKGHGVVVFVDHQAPSDPTVTGGPWSGSDYFCWRHFGAAEQMARAGVEMAEALERLLAAERRPMRRLARRLRGAPRL